jgi:hypothetical protein
MRNPVAYLKAAWYAKLYGALSYDSVTIPVYREDADSIPSSHYVLIRAGGVSNERTADSYMKKVSLFIQVVTKFSSATGINDEIVDNIDGQIQALISPTTLDDGLTDGSLFQVINVSCETENYETFVDEDTKYFIKTSTWEHLCIEK